MRNLALVVTALALGACTAPPVARAPQPLTQQERDMVARRNAVSNAEPKAVACDNWCREWQLNRALRDLEQAVRQSIVVPVYYPVYRSW